MEIYCRESDRLVECVKSGHAGKMILLCGRPAIGKTTAAEYLAEKIAESIDLKEIVVSPLSPGRRGKADKLISVFGTVSGKKVMVVDTLDILCGMLGEKISRSELVRCLKKYAEQTGCIIIVVVGLSRGVEARVDHYPRIHDAIAVMGNIEDFAAVLSVYRGNYYTPSGDSILQISWL